MGSAKGEGGGGRDALRATEIAGRTGMPPPGDGEALGGHAWILGRLQRLLALARAGVVTGGSGEGARHVMADMAIDLAAARELVWRADPATPFTVALAGVAVRDAATRALTAGAAVVDATGWPDFESVRADLESVLRRDPSGGGDLEAVARPLLTGTVAMTGAVTAGAAGPTATGTAPSGVTDLPSRYTGDPPVVTITPEQLAAGRRARAFLHDVLIPLEADDPERDPLPDDMETTLIAEARSRQLWSVATPVEHGGQGLGELGYVLVREQIAQSILGDIRHERGVAGDPWPSLFYADDAQKERFLYPVLRGEKRMFFGLTEPSGGSDAAGIQTRAERSRGGWVINGRKMWIGRGGHQPFGIVFAVTDDAKRAKGGITAFFVEKGTPGFVHVRDLVTMGAACTSELAFEDCRVPDENVLGEVGGAFELAQRTLCRSRVRQAVLNVAAAQRAFDHLVRWLPERVTFGKALGEREPLRWALARAAADLERVRALVYRVAHLTDTGHDPRWEVPPMKTAAAQMACRVIDLSIQLHGAIGISRELPLERLYRDIRGFRISEGADEVQRVLVARELVGRE